MKNTDLEFLQDSAAQATRLLKSMSNVNRLLILCTLIDSPGTSAGNLSKLTGLSPSATSQHLARMKEEDLIECSIDEQRRNYFIKNESIRKVIATLKDIYCPEDLK
ncbi:MULTISPECIES: helix-turn-helix transcriptional regulator [Rahnella]|jgi:DNA-binding transcriptional ArsR family regulator|uniref:ArsR/SmtB family transcription factor n=2 Tax=Rahnella sp. (strain Y9602) TaxID=2703885 RepID=A0ABW6C407_RAHSY|nr:MULTISPECIES: helix-turn-helix transcriptional regulator [Rahnella]AFE59694.1 regulatory protein ArsR [Rahnella aquatilis HX2]AYA08245.1 transcriptional regulator [Rahnella aquatilis]AZP43471.1 helix-turn-helix transcriptional regulator [Rahnella aquatilis]AZP47809.1 helix-turn-helix transcriptional regulator [Rahnella aquatilis]AZP52255.1 helix-turn-helix transcriptional regulator [Rahnella aquatilis]